MVKVGDVVWGMDHYQNLQTGKVRKIFKASSVDGEEKEFVTFGIGFVVPMERVFTSEEDCIKDYQLRSEKKVQEYCDSISTVEDLVKFMYCNCVACAEEYTDWQAREAVERKAKELLNLNLES